MLERASVTKSTRLDAAAVVEVPGVDAAGERCSGVASADAGEAADPVAGAADDAAWREDPLVNHEREEALMGDG